MVKVFITGGTGLVGSRVVANLLQHGNEIVVVSRSVTKAATILFQHERLKVIKGDVTKEGEWQEVASSCDAIIHLAGAGIFDQRWTKSYKQVLVSSRIASTKLVSSLATNILICASATGIYGDQGAFALDEHASSGKEFLSKLCVQWEAEAMRAKARTVLLRFGIILDSQGGALGKMVPIFKIGLGGKVGTGKQYWPWIAWQDAVEVIRQSMLQDWQGPINVVAPEVVTAKEFACVLGKTLHRPSILPVPTFALRLITGKASCMLTASQRVIPSVLKHNQFSYSYPTLAGALRAVCSR